VKPNHAFVGREAVLRDVIDAVSGSEPLVVFVVNGVGGVGKSALLDEIDRRLAGTDACALRVRFAEIVSANGAPEEEQLLTTYREILETLAGQLDPARAGGFREQARRSAALATSRTAVNVARDDIRDAFTQLAGEAGATVVVLGDDVSALGGGTLANWLLDLLRQMARSTRLVTVLTRSGPPPERMEYPGRVVEVTLGALERGEAEGFLAKSGAGRRWVNAIERWCGYYPAAVVLGAELAAEYPDRPEVLDDPDIVGPHGRELVDTLLASLHDEAEQRMIEVAAVVRHFNAELLRSVLAISDELAPPGLEDWLAELPFVERLGNGSYRVRPFLRGLLSARLRAKPPHGTDQVGNRLDEIHELVTRHYAQRVLKDAQLRTYGSWLTIEDRAAQEQQVEFLHHALLIPAGNRFGRFSLARAYFDAFWWWGAYVESDFCRRLLQGSEREARAVDRPFLDALRTFEAAYPPEATGTEPDWAKVRAAIDEIAKVIGVARPLTELVKAEAHVRAILEVFLGQAHAGLDLDASASDDCFARAYDLFGRNDDDRWCLAWVTLYQSSLAAARGRDDAALERARTGLQLATKDVEDEDRDYEVEASLHRAIAEVLWKRGERWTAFRHLAKAVFFAYSFTSIPDPPDEYTSRFYREVSESALDRILELLPERDDARRACAGFLAFWSPYWEIAGQPPEVRSIDSLLRTSPRDVAYCVFPAGPSDDDLEQEGAYAAQVRRVHDGLRPSLDEAVEVFGEEPITTRLWAALRRRQHEPVEEVPSPELQEPAESPELFEPSDDPIWPDHWRVFPQHWRELSEDDPQRAEAEAVVARAVEALPPVWREVLQRRDVDGWTYDDVARRLGVSRSHQTLMLHHSRARVRAALASHFSKAAS
jgi:DNA-directed RNA polymerase specialized sigma24 family protein